MKPPTLHDISNIENRTFVFCHLLIIIYCKIIFSNREAVKFTCRLDTKFLLKSKILFDKIKNKRK